MDSRTAAHVLSQIAAYLELRGENRFKARAYQAAAHAIMETGADDLRPLLESGELARLRGLGPATLAVARDLIETGESRLFERLRQDTPEGMLELVRVPGLGPDRALQLHQTLDISSVEELELAAREGRLATVRGIGPKTAQKILAGHCIKKSLAAVLRSTF